MSAKKIRRVPAKEAAKKSKRDAKAMKRLAKVMCPKCSHPASQHIARVGMGMMGLFIYDAALTQSPSAFRCKGIIEQRGDDGFIRSKECKCDLSSVDAEKNANRGLKAPNDIDLLLRQVEPSQ